jgi:hypothetical protein
MEVAKNPMERVQPTKIDVESSLPLVDHDDNDQIVERLRWTPKQRLDYLLDMLAFEERAQQARRVS